MAVVISRKIYCMVVRVSIDCNGCQEKIRRALLNMKEVESHQIEKQRSLVSVCGSFAPWDFVVSLRRAINQRIEILEIEEMGVKEVAQEEAAGGENGQKTLRKKTKQKPH